MKLTVEMIWENVYQLLTKKIRYTFGRWLDFPHVFIYLINRHSRELIWYLRMKQQMPKLCESIDKKSKLMPVTAITWFVSVTWWFGILLNQDMTNHLIATNVHFHFQPVLKINRTTHFHFSWTIWTIPRNTGWRTFLRTLWLKALSLQRDATVTFGNTSKSLLTSDRALTINQTSHSTQDHLSEPMGSLAWLTAAPVRSYSLPNLRVALLNSLPFPSNRLLLMWPWGGHSWVFNLSEIL